MYIEDLLTGLDQAGGTNRFDKKVIESLSFQINFNGRGFTEKQSQLALKLLKRYTTTLNVYFKQDISQFIDNPLYRFSIRTPVTVNKYVSIVPHDTWGKAIKVEFPYNDNFVEAIRKHRSMGGFSVWEKEKRAWMFNLSESNIQLIKNLIEQEHFEIDEEFKNYLQQVDKVVNTMEKFMPMLIVEENLPKFVNLPRFIPQIECKDIVSAMFEARKFGVSVWDDQVETFINSENVEDVVRSFLTTQPTENFHVDCQTTPMIALKNIVKYLEPVMIIVPGGMELEKTSMAYEFLKEIGVADEEMSVMFRLPSGSGKNFNDFVKEKNLNNPVSDNTRFVFVSTKIPKPVLYSKKKFNSIISLGLYNMHYTVRDFVKNCPNVIFYCEQKPSKEISFGNL